MSKNLPRPILWVAYVMVVGHGFAALFVPPKSLEAFSGVWAVLSIAGGGFGAWAVFTQAWRIERWAAPLALGGVGSYVFSVWAAVVTETPSRLSQAFVVTVAVMLLLDRSVYLAKKASGIRSALELIKENNE